MPLVPPPRIFLFLVSCFLFLVSCFLLSSYRLIVLSSYLVIAIDVAHVGIIFEIIYKAHTTLYILREQNCWNVPQALCNMIYVKLCPVCDVDQPKIVPIKGCPKPIRSFQFRDRMQCDLVDYRNAPAPMFSKHPNSPICYWL